MYNLSIALYIAIVVQSGSKLSQSCHLFVGRKGLVTVQHVVSLHPLAKYLHMCYTRPKTCKDVFFTVTISKHGYM